MCLCMYIFVDMYMCMNNIFSCIPYVSILNLYVLYDYVQRYRGTVSNCTIQIRFNNDIIITKSVLTLSLKSSRCVKQIKCTIHVLRHATPSGIKMQAAESRSYHRKDRLFSNRRVSLTWRVESTWPHPIIKVTTPHTFCCYSLLVSLIILLPGWCLV